MFEKIRPMQLQALAALGALMISACSQSPEPPPKSVGAEADERPLMFPRPGSLLDSTFADLSSDALIPPDAPELDIAASPGKVTLSWEGMDQPHTATLYRYDSLTGIEQEIDVAPNPSNNSVTLDSRTHLTAWHRQQFRVQLCTLDDCVSSRRETTTHLASQSVNTIVPGVFVESERYAQDVALNHDGSLLVATLPVEGSIDMHQRIGHDWIVLDRVRLYDLPISTTRQLAVTLSDSGNTMAILLSDSGLPEMPSTQLNNSVIILERLGEAWVETSRMSLQEQCGSGPAQSPEEVTQNELNTSPLVGKKSPSVIKLSANGDKALIHCADSVVVIEQQSIRWSVTDFWIPMPSNSAENQLLAVNASATLDKVFTLSRIDQQLVLNIRQSGNDEQEAHLWQNLDSHAINGINPYRNVQLAVDQLGDTVAIAGWEDINSSIYTPVFWRYSIAMENTDNGTVINTRITATDSLRQAPTTHSDATLTLTADSTLTTIALAWQGGYSVDTDAHTDAAMSTYLYGETERFWQPALELPESIPTLAKQVFAEKLLLSGDAGTLLMSGTTNSLSEPARAVGGISVLR